MTGLTPWIAGAMLGGAAVMMVVMVVWAVRMAEQPSSRWRRQARPDGPVVASCRVALSCRDLVGGAGRRRDRLAIVGDQLVVHHPTSPTFEVPDPLVIEASDVTAVVLTGLFTRWGVVVEDRRQGVAMLWGPDVLATLSQLPGLADVPRQVDRRRPHWPTWSRVVKDRRPLRSVVG